VNGLDEGELLEEFITRRDESAFEALVLRHGPMVLGICRQLLRDPNDVDDAFQATFLILARKAASLRRRDLLGNWLYGVAYRVASQARSLAARRASRHCNLGQVDPREIEAASAVEPEADAIAWLHEEVSRLPDKYRAPIVLCYLEGLTHEEASDRLRWPLGTLKGRLSQAKNLLRKRLGRRGADSAKQDPTDRLRRDAMESIVPQLLLMKTIGSALLITGKDIGAYAGSAAVSQSIIDLVQGASQAMTISQIRTWALPGLLGVSATLTGVGIIAIQAAGPARPSRIVADSPATYLAPGDTPSPKPSPEKLAHARPTTAQPSSGGKPSQKPHPTERSDDGEGPLKGSDMSSGLVRQFNAQMGQKIAQADPNPKSKAVMKKLDEPISVVFPHETPLEDVLKYIQSATSSKGDSGLPIYVDPRGLEDQKESLKSTVIINLEGIPLRTTLHLILKQLHLAYCVRDGVVIVSSAWGIKQELVEICAELGVPVPELVRPNFPFRPGMQLPSDRGAQKQQ
jgi:RNA polymerase sigma factor (sigma-70 family)